MKPFIGACISVFIRIFAACFNIFFFTFLFNFDVTGGTVYPRRRWNNCSLSNPVGWFHPSSCSTVSELPCSKVDSLCIYGIDKCFAANLFRFLSGELKALQIGRECCVIFVVFKRKTSQSASQTMMWSVGPLRSAIFIFLCDTCG